MKKILTLIAALGFFGATFGATLNPMQAFQRVRGAANFVPGLAAKTQIPKLVFTGNTEASQPAYYVFSDGFETLFVSADDVATPLLGYSDSGEFDPRNMPPQLKWWLGQYAREIEWAAKNGVAPASASQKRRAASSMAAIQPLLKTIWNQGEPFNKYAPILNGEQCVTGCVATAMAQVMDYYQWPTSEVSAISYTWNNQTLTSPATVLDWKNMLDSYENGYTEVQANAVARLMQLAGYSVNMGYDVSANGGSSASSSSVRNALVNNFGYDVAAEMCYRGYYSSEEWMQLIYNELNANRPVYYSGQGDEGGHAFVCDGYDGNGSFHFNWGWSGHYNGYFRLSALNPEGVGIGGGGGGYNSSQSALVNVGRPKGGSVAPTPYIACDGELVGLVSGRTLYVRTISTDDGFWNFGASAAKFTLGVRLENVSTAEEVNITSNIQNYEFGIMRGFTSFYASIPASLSDGTYKAYPIFKVESGDWESIKLKNDTPQYITINISGGKPSMDGSLVFTSWTSTTGFISGEAFSGQLIVYNPSSDEQTITLDAYLCKGTPDNFEVCAELGSSTKSVEGITISSIPFSGELPQLDSGEYYLVFKEAGVVKKYLTVEVSVVEAMRILSITADPDPIVIGYDSSVEVVWKNTFKTPQQLNAALCICSQTSSGMLNIDFNYGAQKISIAPNSSNTITYAATIPSSLAAGSYLLTLVNMDNYDVIEYKSIEIIADYGDINLKTWEQVSRFVSGEEFEGILTVENTHPVQQYVSYDAYLCKIENDAFNIYADLGSAHGYIPAKSTGELNYSGTLARINPGEYYLVFTTEDRKIIGNLAVEVAASDGEIKVVSMAADPHVLTPGESSSVEITIQNTYSTAKKVDMTLYLCEHEDDQFWIEHTYGAESLTIEPGTSVSATFSTVIPATQTPGTYYILLYDTANSIIMGVMEVQVKEKSELSGLEAIENDDSVTEVRYFNVKGVEVSADNLTPGAYIVRQGSQTKKVLIK